MYRILCFLFFLSYSPVICFSFSNSTKLCPHHQNVALLRLKQLFSIDVSASSSDDCNLASFAKTDTWKEGTNCCSWDGVTCNRVTGLVIGLDLSCSGLYGVIAPEISHLSNLVSLDLSIYSGLGLETSSFTALAQNLTKLQKLHLRGINVSSILPISLLNLSSLKSMDLSSCQLYGRFPDDDLQLPNLKVLKLKGNHDLSGNFPKFNESNSMLLLDLSSTNFSGELPSSIGSLKSLESLDLSSTKFSGELPSSIGSLKSLESLDLSHCNFSGSIPSVLGNLTQITHLDLSSNQFDGEISNVFNKIRKLIVLDLSSNSFRGQFIASLDNLTELSFLDLSNNNLEGIIPSHVKELSSLSDVHLSNNLLNGTIPSWLFSLPSLIRLDLSHNKLNGHIDEFQSPSLESIDLSNNELDGPVPSSIFELVNLTYLQLSSNNLGGIVETDMFMNLENLIYLDLSYNILTLSNYGHSNCALPFLETLLLSSCNISEFPRFLCSQEVLEFLDLSNNKIYGQLPKWAWNMGTETLSYFNLSQNLLTGFERFPWKNMLFLDLHSNLLQGPLPSLICEMSYISVLDFSNNNLSGLIPQCLGNFSESLSVLDLRMNQLHGNIPKTFSKGNFIRNLGFNGNQLEGPLPRSLINCRRLQVLDLGNNRINDTFPYWLETLPELQVLILRSNRFHGHISGSNFQSPFPKLRIMDLSRNDFSGSLPEMYLKNFKAMMNVTEDKMKLKYMGEYYYRDSIMGTIKGFDFEFVILSTFTTIDLSSNRFQGEILDFIGSLSSLRELNLSHNNLTGHIPSSLGNLMVLESLDLSSNKLSGRIPRELTSLTFLEVLNLSKNHLTGVIPRGNQFDTFANNSYSGNIGLCGFPLSKKCVVDEAPQPPKEEEVESDTGFDWKVILMGYGCGLVVGLFMGASSS
ncbi:receptor-like protein 53 [Vitis riparia]|uniref:receptor-like protein 53 n=1 Tax=Vitis riparia TaxID=96939 RepID=UPI00155A5101|nr:receptor-like protein 53 [Vitis riparia]